MTPRSLSRRETIAAGAALIATPLLAPALKAPARAQAPSKLSKGASTMGIVTTRDGVDIFYKDWGPKNAQPIVFHHGWPLSSDDWDSQMLFFLQQGYR